MRTAFKRNLILRSCDTNFGTPCTRSDHVTRINRTKGRYVSNVERDRE